MDAPEVERLLRFYEDRLFGKIMPFWMSRGIDQVHGGFFTCFNNRGDRLLHRHKFTWSQGRFVWVLARLARVCGDRRPEDEVGSYLEQARRGAAFLMAHARLANGNCAFILSETGEPILLDAESNPRAATEGEAYDTSVYADLFVVYGLAEYAMAADDAAAYEFAVDVYERVKDRTRGGRYRSDPYPVPVGYETHGLPMILLETARELSQAARRFDEDRSQAFLNEARVFMEAILDTFRDPATNVIAEFHAADAGRRATMLGSHVTPGHMFESMWFALHLAKRLELEDRIRQALAVVRAACALGWDEAYGGFPRYLHREGGAPRGPVPPELEGQEMIRHLRSSWDTKLWWVHSEALYSLLLAHAISGEAYFLEWYRRVHEYSFRTFPNPDDAVGEWIQIRARDGTPVDKIVALPVKDPFHISRAFILCLELLASLQAGQ